MKPGRKVGIINIGVGNITSLLYRIEHILPHGDCVVVIDDCNYLAECDLAILPGVGNYGAVMNAIDDRGFRKPIIDFCLSGRSFLGICVGMQVLGNGSEESPEARGLGVVPGYVKKFISSQDFKVPHVGWNFINHYGDIKNKLIEGVELQDVYFTHSYFFYPDSVNDVAAITHCPKSATGESDYFVSAVGRGNVYGTQFHPEKSSKAGERILSNFLLS
jgi:imidazole glycerol phosphate synthase glutamine amidotransferase subunit